MGKAKHTPGPWSAEHLTGLSYEIRSVETFQVIATTRNNNQSEANARLIAAAPELLAEAEKDLEILIELRDKHLFGAAAVTRALVQKRIEATQDAIAKAKGEDGN